MAKFRAKLKSDPEQLAKIQEKKRLENKKYKDKIRTLRGNNSNLNTKCKMAQRNWKRASRKKRVDLEKKIEEEKERRNKEREATNQKKIFSGNKPCQIEVTPNHIISI